MYRDLRHGYFGVSYVIDDHPSVTDYHSHDHSLFSCAMSDTDIWADMDTSSTLPSGALANQMAMLEEHGDYDVDAMQWQNGQEVGDNVEDIGPDQQPSMDAFVLMMASNEELFYDPQRMLSAPFHTKQWIQEQLCRVTDVRDIDYSRKWINLLGDEMDLNRYVVFFEQAVDEFTYLSQCAAEHKPHPIVLPITIFLRAFDVFLACKAVALGLAEMPADGDDMLDDNQVPICGWSPNVHKWAPFLPLFSEIELLEALMHIFTTDFMQRGCLPPFQFNTSSRLLDISRRLRGLLDVSADGNPTDMLLQPVDMFTVRVVQHLRQAVAARIRCSAADTLPDAIQELVVSYTMDVSSEVDHYIANALSSSPASSGSCSAFIQVLHSQLFVSVFSGKRTAYNEWTQPITIADVEKSGITRDFMGSLCLPVSLRVSRMPAIDMHMRLVHEFKQRLMLRPLFHQNPASRLNLQALDSKKRRKWRRELRVMAKSGVNLIRTYPTSAHTVRSIMHLIKQLPADERIWSAWSPAVMSRFEYLSKRKNANLQPVDLSCMKITPPSAPSAMQCGM